MILSRTRKSQNALLLASILLVIGLTTPKVEALQVQSQDRLSQTRVITGIIISDTDKQPIPGVSILIKGTTNGTVTNMDGEYSLSVTTASPVLIVSYIGYVAQEVIVGNQETISITLQENISELGEMIVMGYRSQKGATISGAIVPVDVSALESRRVPIVTQALQGQVAGVQVTQSTGAPGDEIEIRIRGNGTIGNNNPLGSMTSKDWVLPKKS